MVALIWLIDLIELSKLIWMRVAGLGATEIDRIPDVAFLS